MKLIISSWVISCFCVSNLYAAEFGAVAFSFNTTSSEFAFVINQPSVNTAKSNALAKCKDNCGIATVFTKCGAAVIGTQPSAPGIGKYFSDRDVSTLSEAENIALGKCEWYAKVNNQTCRVVASGCN